MCRLLSQGQGASPHSQTPTGGGGENNYVPHSQGEKLGHRLEPWPVKPQLLALGGNAVRKSGILKGKVTAWTTSVLIPQSCSLLGLPALPSA